MSANRNAERAAASAAAGVDYPGARVAAFQVSVTAGNTGASAAIRDHDHRAGDDAHEVANKVLEKAKSSGMFWFVDSDLKRDKPQPR